MKQKKEEKMDSVLLNTNLSAASAKQIKKDGSRQRCALKI